MSLQDIRQNKEGDHVGTALECGCCRLLLAPTGVIKWEQGHIAPPSLEKQKLWALYRKHPLFLFVLVFLQFSSLKSEFGFGFFFVS